MVAVAAFSRSPVATLWMLLAACCTAGDSAAAWPTDTESTVAAASVNGTRPGSFPTVQPSSASTKPAVSLDDGCMSVLSLGTIAERWRPTVVTLGFDGRSSYAFDEADGAIVEKPLSSSAGAGGARDCWRRLGGGDGRLRGVVGMVRGVALPLPLPPGSSLQRQLLPPAPALLVTTDGWHCIRGVHIDAARASYTVSHYLGSSCDGKPNDQDGTFVTGRLAWPRHLALKRSSAVLYVVEREAVRTLDFSANNLGTVLSMNPDRYATSVGAYLSPDEEFLFLLLRDGSITPVNLARRTSGTVLRVAAGRSGLDLSSTDTWASMLAVAWTGTAAEVPASAASRPCSERYLLAAGGGLAVAVRAPSGPQGQLNVTRSFAERVLVGALYTDGRSLLVISERNASGSRPAGTEYLLLSATLGLPPPTRDPPGSSTTPALPGALTTVAIGAAARTVGPADGEGATGGSSGSGGSSNSTDSLAATDPVPLLQCSLAYRDTTPAATLASGVGHSIGGQSRDSDLAAAPSSAAAATSTAVPSTTSGLDLAAVTAGPEAASTGHTVPVGVSRGAPLSLGGPDPSIRTGADSAEQHADDAALASTLSAAGAVCVCLLVIAVVLLARRLRRSPVTWNRRATVKLGKTQDDCIILVSPGGDPACNSGGSDGGAGACAVPLQQLQQQQPSLADQSGGAGIA